MSMLNLIACECSYGKVITTLCLIVEYDFFTSKIPAVHETKPTHNYKSWSFGVPFTISYFNETQARIFKHKSDYPWMIEKGNLT